MEELHFEDDLLTVSDNVSGALNIFSQTKFNESKLVTVYGDDEFIALLTSPYNDGSNAGSLKMRTKTMGSDWENVPIGFSKIDQCEGLLHDMKASAHVSAKRNSLWYLDQTLQDCVGENIEDRKVQAKNGKYSYYLKLRNKVELYLAITKDMEEYKKPHYEARLYALANKEKQVIGQFMTADECILFISNIARQVDQRSLKFTKEVQKYFGKTMITASYRTQEESLDETKAIFKNGYALTLELKADEKGNDTIRLNIFALMPGQSNFIDSILCADIDEVLEYVKTYAEKTPYSGS